MVLNMLKKEIKICSKCRKKYPATPDCFHRCLTGKNGLRPDCKNCVKAYQQSKYGKKLYQKAAKKYSRTKKGRISQRKHRESSFEKRRAHMALRHAIEIGKAKRPNKCSDCNKKCKPEGHHWDYDKPLEVIWLCKQCHCKLHSEIIIKGKKQND